jgi:hypothetical protein
MISKKGELTTRQIVIFIILIASFAIILFFLIRLNLGAETEKEVCHNSVVLKSNQAIPTDAVPLNCKTTYVCITKDGSCENLLNPQKEKVKTEEDIYEVMAKELADCWWMFGEGNLNYVGSEAVSKMYCARCSQISFDDSVNSIPGFETGEFDRENLYKYMAKEKISPDQTYSEYLYGTNNYQAFLNLKGAQNVNYGTFDTSKHYSVITGMSSKTSKLAWLGIGAGVVIFTALTGGAGFVAIAVAAAAGGAAGYFVLAPVAENAFGTESIIPSLVRTDNGEFEGLGCERLETKS